MTLAEFFAAIGQLSALTFVVTSMLAMGLSLTIPQIMQPLRNGRLVALALLANFVLVPLVAYLIVLVLPLDQSIKTGLILLATAAGAPFLPKLVQVAKGDIAFGVGLMVLLMVGTIVYMPVVLPFLLQGVQVNAWDIAKSLILLLLVPLAIGLLVKANSPETAQQYQPLMSKVSGLAILVLMVVGLGLNVSNILGLIGTGGILALLLFIVASFTIGFVLGGRQPGTRSVMALGTAQRNVSAAIVVAAQNFSSDPNVLVVLLVGSILLVVGLMATARRLGGAQQASTADDGTPATPAIEPTQA